jgi:hypothetical protein
MNVLPDFDPNFFKGQFILSAEINSVLIGWANKKHLDWNLYTADLPVIEVYSEENIWMGWCIGHPIVDGVLEPNSIILQYPLNEIDPYEDFYSRTTGKWILIILDSANPSVFLDPHGSLPAVFSTIERTIASTPTLIGTDADWDEKMMSEIGFPEKIHWLPSGLTFKKHVRRLQANHCLLLTEWKVSRHWPTPKTDFSIDNNIESAVTKIISNIQDTITATQKIYPLCLTLTGGMDSRVVLACARDHVLKIKIITFAGAKETLDMYLAKRLAKQLHLNHRFLPIQNSTPEELEQWLITTGKSVAGDVWKISKTLTQLDASRVFMSGQSGEVHRGNYWRRGDTADKKITASELLKRSKFPLHPLLLNATEKWLDELKFLNTFNTLDLVHIEQRMSCWGSIQAFGNRTSLFEISPLGSRLVFQSMMKLPHKYRKKQQLPYDICKKVWPELLQLPFNEYPGIYGFFRSKAKKLKKMYFRMKE